jgi:uracil-DNA glycosylase
MATLLDNLVENIQRQISRGETDVRVDANVLKEFYTDYQVPVQAPAVPTQTITPQAQTQATPVVQTAAPATPIHAATPVIQPAVETTPVHAATPVIQPAVETTPVQTAIPVVQTAVETAPIVQQSAPLDLSSFSLPDLRQRGNSCSACQFSLGEKRSKDTAKNSQAKLMIISEPAGRSEEQMTDPFHGEAGALLLKMLGALKINLDDVYMCMAHRCYGPGAREKIIETKPYLLRQIELVKPDVLLIFGGAALNILVGEQSLMNSRGHWLEVQGVPTIATFPPAYLIHKAEAKRDAWNDMKQVMSRLQ